MDRTPLFPCHAVDATPEDFQRNFWCPHYELCLDEAANMNFHLDCSECKYKDARISQKSIQSLCTKLFNL